MEELEKLIREYLDIPKDFTAINDMMFLREQIAGNLYYLGSEVGQARKKLMAAKSLYEAKKIYSRMKYLDEGVGRATTISRANSTRELENANEADGDFNILKYQYESAREVLSALNQKISWLKSEQQYIRAIGG